MMLELDRSTVLKTSAAALAALALGLAVQPAPASAQETDSRWLAWTGCWEPVGQEGQRVTDDALVCFQPLQGSEGIERVTVRDGEVASRQTLIANGAERDVAEQGCSGWERGDFSAQPGRVYFTSELTCDGGGAQRMSGVMAMVDFDEWVDVRVSDIEGEGGAWVTRYQLAYREDAEAAGFGSLGEDRSMAIRTARAAGSTRPEVDDVIEASSYVSEDAVTAWLVEHGDPIDLDAAALVQLADAGVSEQVIDAAIAVTYPEKFAFAGGPQAVDRGYDSYGAYGAGRPYYDPFPYSSFFYSPFGIYYSPWGYRTRFGLGFGNGGFGYGGYGGFGYGGYGGFGFGGYYRGPTIIRVDGDRDTGSRVISGQGWRQGQGTRPSTRSAQPRSGSSTGSSARPAARGSTTRSAQPRSGSSGSRSGSSGSATRRRGGGGGGV